MANRTRHRSVVTLVLLATLSAPAACAMQDAPESAGEEAVVSCRVRSADWSADRARLERHGVVRPDDRAIWRDLSDCILVTQIIGHTLERDPPLVDLTRRVRARLTELESDLPEAAFKALLADQALFERSLRRDLRLDRHARTAAAADRVTLRSRWAERLDWLDRLDPNPAGFPGVWRNATGAVSITLAEPGTFRVEAHRVEIEFLAWTCEFAGVSHAAAADTLQDLGDTSLRFRLADAVLLVEQSASAADCGGGASLSGAYFATRSTPAA